MAEFANNLKANTYLRHGPHDREMIEDIAHLMVLMRLLHDKLRGPGTASERAVWQMGVDHIARQVSDLVGCLECRLSGDLSGNEEREKSEDAPVPWDPTADWPLDFPEPK